MFVDNRNGLQRVHADGQKGIRKPAWKEGSKKIKLLSTIMSLRKGRLKKVNSSWGASSRRTRKKKVKRS